MRTRYLSVASSGLSKLTHSYHDAVAHAWSNNGTVFFFNPSVQERIHNLQHIAFAGPIVRDFSKNLQRNHKLPLN